MSKYPAPEIKKHAKLIKAWSEGAEIQSFEDTWVDVKVPSFSPLFNYRIVPDCNYALAKIAEIGGDDMTDLYIYWLYGGEVEIIPEDHNTYIEPLPAKNFEDPFDLFLHESICGVRFRKKNRKVKQVLWVCSHWAVDVNDSGSYRPEVWLDIARDNVIEHDLKYYPRALELASMQWHKVPTMVREVEA